MSLFTSELDPCYLLQLPRVWPQINMPSTDCKRAPEFIYECVVTVTPSSYLRGRITSHSVVRDSGDGLVSFSIAPHSLIQQLFIKIYYVLSIVPSARIK